jgi:LysR family hydrogen peroxide-inducible transcriptional activator
LDEKKIDMGIMAGPFNQARIRTIPLYREEILIYAPELKGKELNPDMLESLQPWLLSKGNCLRTQMIHFCELNSESQTRSWNYEGGSIDLLKKMVDLNGGYTLIPKFYDKTSKTRRLRDASTKEYPAREIIAMFPERSIKLDICMSISRLIQLKYGQRLDEDMRILSWR